MSLSTADIGIIVGKASTLTERLSGAFLPVVGDPPKAQRRLSRWKTHVAANDPVEFAAVLRACGAESLVENDVLALFDEVKMKPGEPWPEWVSVLHELTEGIALGFDHPTNATVANPPRRERSGAVPFIDLYQPVAEYAWQRVESAIPQVALLGTAARRDLQTNLLRSISSVFSVVLHNEFLAHKAFAESEKIPHWFTADTTADDSTETRLRYRSFVSEQGKDGLRRAFLRYPAAARLVAEVTIHWTEFVGEFLQRLDHDRHELSSLFNHNVAVAELTRIQTGDSDSHHQGRTVMILTFDTGLRLVYKPRPMSVDRLFFALVESLNEAGLKPPLLALRVLDRGDYGWMEFADHLPCSDSTAARRFYRRAGSLACLLHWLQGIDCHWTNFIAAGEQPVLIDLEALAHPLSPSETRAIVEGSFPMPLASSILRTGFLPLWQTRPNDALLYDNSALGAATTQRGLVKSMQWRDVNTDRMEWRMEEKPRRHRAHRLRLNGKTLPARSYSRETVAGFTRVIDLLQGDAADSFHDLRKKMQAATRRRITRPTLVYWIFRRRSLRPEMLADGIDRSLELYALPRGSCKIEEWLTEVSDLEKLDIPHFETDAGSPNGSDPLFDLSKDGNLEQQIEIVRAALSRKFVMVEGQIFRLSEWRKSRPPD